MYSLQIQEGGGKKERGDVLEGDRVGIPNVYYGQSLKKCNGAAQNTRMEQLGTLAVQHQYGKPWGYGESM